jgi:hypothetical protein
MSLDGMSATAAAHDVILGLVQACPEDPALSEFRRTEVNPLPAT